MMHVPKVTKLLLHVPYDEKGYALLVVAPGGMMNAERPLFLVRGNQLPALGGFFKRR